jgi:hypothetical protein
MSTIRVRNKELRDHCGGPGITVDVPQSFEKGDGERPVAMDVLVVNEHVHVQLIDYGVLDGVAHKRRHHKKDEDDDANGKKKDEDDD